MPSVIRGVGAYLPATRLTNQDMESRVDTTAEWISERTGIEARHIAAEGELTSDLAAAASREALKRAGLTAADVDLIIVATTTPDETLPATAVILQRKLGIAPCAAFDVQAVCSGFIYALATADALLKAGAARTALVVGGETFSRIIDWTDRGTCVLFGDGAGAVILQTETAASEHPRGVLAYSLGADGTTHDLLYTDGGVSLNQRAGVLKMVGKEVFRHAVTRMTSAAQQVCEKAGVPLSEVDWLVPHQANRRILDAVAEKLGFPTEKCILTVDRHANTSAASIPLALEFGVSNGLIQHGNNLVLPALGAGLTWGACFIRW